RRVGAQIVDDGSVGEALDEPRSEDRRRDPEDDVAVADLRLEVFLPDVARAGRNFRVRMPADHEERVDAPVTRAIGIELEASLADRSVTSDERRDGVVHELEVGRVVHAEEGVDRWARASDRRLRMTARAAHEVEARANALVDFLLLGE